MRKTIRQEFYERHIKIADDVSKAHEKVIKNHSKKLMKTWSKETITEKIIIKDSLISRLLIKLGLFSYKIEESKQNVYTEGAMTQLLTCVSEEAKSIVRNDACEAKWGR